MRNLLICISLTLTSSINFSYGQKHQLCDSITVYNNAFDSLFQTEYESVKSDTVLAIRHCYSTNGCSSSFGLLCWKINGSYHYKLILKEEKGIGTDLKVKREIQEHLISFFDSKIYSKTEEVLGQQYWIDDGAYTAVILKTTENCWRFNYTLITSNDPRVVWTERLIELMW